MFDYVFGLVHPLRVAGFGCYSKARYLFFTAARNELPFIFRVGMNIAKFNPDATAPKEKPHAPTILAQVEMKQLKVWERGAYRRHR